MADTIAQREQSRPAPRRGVEDRKEVERKEVDVRGREQWFAGRVAIVVGATGGIGAAICEEFGERGAGLPDDRARLRAVGENRC